MYPFTLFNVILMRCSSSVPGIIPHSSRWPEKENDFNLDGRDFGLFSDKRNFSGLYVAFTISNILKYLFPSLKIFVWLAVLLVSCIFPFERLSRFFVCKHGIVFNFSNDLNLF